MSWIDFRVYYHQPTLCCSGQPRPVPAACPRLRLSCMDVKWGKQAVLQVLYWCDEDAKMRKQLLVVVCPLLSLYYSSKNVFLLFHSKTRPPWGSPANRELYTPWQNIWPTLVSPLADALVFSDMRNGHFHCFETNFN